MNLTGKILTFLILFLSVAFLVLAVMVGATHRNWKEVANENKQKLQEARNILNTYKGKSEEINKKLNAERVARRMQLAQLESQLNTARTERDDKEKLLRQELEISESNQEALNNAEKRLTEKDRQVAELRTRNKELVDDIATQRQSVVNLTNQVYTLQGEQDQLKTMLGQKVEELAKRIKVMNAIGVGPDELTDQIPPEVEGVVLRTKDNLIAISVGSDDGVRSGHIFDVYRGDRFVGKAEVTRSRENMSAARLIPEFLQSPVTEGDYVTTKF